MFLYVFNFDKPLKNGIIKVSKRRVLMQYNLYISNTYLHAFNMILDKLNLAVENTNAKQFLVVPDRFTLNAEKSVFEKLSIKSTFNIEVITLSKLATKVLNAQTDNKKLLTKQSGVMLVTKIILNKQNELKAYKKATKLTGFAKSIFETITQLKSCNITPEEFENSYTGENLALKLKMHDIFLIYKEYELLLKSGYLDANTKLSLLVENLPNSDFIKNTHFYFALFDNFTPKQYLIIQNLIKYASSVNVGFASNTKQNNQNIYPTNMYENLTTIAKLYSMQLKDIIKNDTEHLPNEFNHIAKNFYALNKNQVELKTDAVQLVQAKTVKEEVQFVASKITENIILNNYRYKDINVAVANIEQYAPVIEQVFKNYKIPYFIDKSKVLTEHIYVKFIINALNAVKNNLLTNDVLSFSKNYFTDLTFEEQNKFEDFVLKYGITNTQFLKEFAFNKKDENTQIIEQARKKIVNNLAILNKDNNKTVKEHVNTLKEFLKNVNVKEKLQNLEKEYELSNNYVEQKITTQVYDKVDNLLQELTEILQNEKVTIAEFYNLLNEGLNATNVSTIPVSVDSVFVGDINNNNFSKTNMLCVLGAVDGEVPQNKLDVGIILDEELNDINAKVKLEPSINQLNQKSKFNFFQLLLTANNKLILSYPLTSNEGKQQKKSLALTEFEKLFYITVNGKYINLPIYSLEDYIPTKYTSENSKALAYSFYYANPKVAVTKLIEQAKQVYNNNNTFNYKAVSTLYHTLQKLYGKEYLDNLIDLFDYKNTFQNIKNADELFFNKKRTKISQIESYFACPFKHFLDYGLKVKEKQRAGLTPLDVGNILHSVAEQFGAMLKAENSLHNQNLSEVASLLINRILSKPEYSFIINTKENKNLIESIKQEALRLVQAIYFSNLNSDFNIEKLEFSFGIKDESTALKLQVKNKTITFGGIIDRIDFYDDYFRVIDYKTGNSKFAFKDLYSGKKIQLFIYASVIKNLTNKKCAGVFYFPIKNEFDEDVTTQKHSIYKMEGTFLNNFKVIKAMDKTLSPTSPKSQLINATFKTSKNNITELDHYSKKRSFDEEDFKNIEDYTLKLSKKAITEILQGNITPTPYAENSFSVCDYCKFNAVCKFSEDFKNVKREQKSKITKNTFKEAVTNE